MKTVLHTLAILGLMALSGCDKISRVEQTPPTKRVETGSPRTIVSNQDTFIPKGTILPGTPTIKVALLLPLSGDSATIGNAMLDAATLALYDAYLAVPSNQIKSQIILMPKDTGNTPAEAASAAKQAIEQGASFIVGPIFSQSVNAVAPIARSKNVPILSFSNNRAVAGNGVYVYGVQPEQQVKRVADYAFLYRMQRVALLAPNDSYGQKIQANLSATYLKKGGFLSTTELYAPSVNNIDAAVSRLAATYNSLPEERRFQAIFVADGGGQLKNLIPALKRTNIDLKKIKLFGVSLWDDPEIANIPGIEGMLFSSLPQDAFGDFERRFASAYPYKPVRLAGMAYDAVTLLATVSMSSSQPRIDTAALVDPKGFFGPANGLFRLRPSGVNERRLAIMEIHSAGFKTVEPALKFFDEKEEEELPLVEDEPKPAAPKSAD